MQAWLRKLCVSRAAGAAAPAALPLAARTPAVPLAASAACERLEDRRLLSATLDLTNTYAGTVTIKGSGTKVKEAINIVFTGQSAAGYVTGQISSAHSGKVDVKGMVAGKQVKVVGSTSGRLLVAKVGKNGITLTGTLVNGVDDSVGKFKVKKASDAPESLPAAGRAAGAVSVSTTQFASLAAGKAEAAVPADGGALDPSIDPATGLPIDPATGLPIDPSVLPPDTTPTTPAIPPDISAGGGTPTAAVGGTVGNNVSFLGTYSGVFNNDGTGSIENTTTGSTTGGVAGIDPRTATFTTVSQDATGLVTGTLTISNFATFNYSGFVNGSDVSLVLSGTGTATGSGVVTLSLSGTGDTFTGVVTAAQSNGFTANGPINGAFVSGPAPGTGTGTGSTLPAGEELYHVDVATSTGEATTGNLDPNNATLGNDFAVGIVPLNINSLGAFDSGADGLAGTIRVAIYNITNTTTPVLVADVTTANSELAPNSSYRYLTNFTPVTLGTGVYRIATFGFDTTDLAGDVAVDTYQGPAPSASNGIGSNSIVYPSSNVLSTNNYFSQPGGGGAGGGGTLTYPTQAAGTPNNRFLAGSFLFEEGTIVDPGGGNGGTPPPAPPPPPTLVKAAGTAFPGGVYTGTSGPEVFGSQSGGIIPG
ncbi:MAG: autotransporter-associated beta strand repeat protein [Phycisphaerales bacterium]|nr:autotransporter-associated beta strand repeat protein [Phycisphaerales bacterium]